MVILSVIVVLDVCSVWVVIATSWLLAADFLLTLCFVLVHFGFPFSNVNICDCL